MHSRVCQIVIIARSTFTWWHTHRVGDCLAENEIKTFYLKLLGGCLQSMWLALSLDWSFCSTCTVIRTSHGKTNRNCKSKLIKDKKHMHQLHQLQWNKRLQFYFILTMTLWLQHQPWTGTISIGVRNRIEVVVSETWPTHSISGSDFENDKAKRFSDRFVFILTLKCEKWTLNQPAHRLFMRKDNWTSHVI